VVLVAIALLALFGTPAVLVRIGLIGSAAAETASASIAAGTMGASLGGDSYTQQVFAVAFMAMSLSGAMWMLCTLIMTPLLKKGGKSLAKRNPAVMALIPTAALLGAFSALTIAELPKSNVHLILVGISAASMGLCLYLAKALNQKWLKEWALGISIVIALVSAYFLHTA
jgi:flagellar biosynthesis protein FlhB